MKPLPRVLAALAVFVLFVISTAALLFPLSVQFTNYVPDRGDPLENTWVLASVARALIADPLTLYHANIFYPYPNALAFSESQVASALVALPVLFATDNSILAYNFVFLAAFVLSAFSTYLLAFDVTKQRAGALLAGLAFAFWAYKFNHLSHINLVTLQWLPLVLFALRRALRQNRIVFPILFAVTLVLQALSSWYAALMTMLIVALYVVYAFFAQRGKWERARWVTFAFCFAFALAVIAVVAIPYFQVSAELQFARTLTEAERFSARPLSFVSVAPFNWLYRNVLPKAVGEALFPGALILLLAAFGLRKNFPDRAFWLVAILFFALIAFGATFQLAPSLEFPSPLYQFLYEFVPGFQGTRAPARFFVVGMLGLALLAANGFALLTNNFRGTERLALTALAFAILGVESLTIPIRTIAIETNAQIPPVYQWLKTQPAGNVLEVPVRVGDIEPITRAMYFSIVHQRAMPLGYASFVPPTQIDFLHTLNTALETPSPRVPNLLREFDVRYVILHRDADDAEFYENAFAQLPSLEIAYEDATQRAYFINAAAPEHPLQLGCLAPAYALPNAQYLAYLTIQHTRRYPIVNDDLQTHEIKLEWRAQNDSRIVHTQRIRLPYVLRERVEGVPVRVTAPPNAGEYELRCFLDGATEPLRTQRVRVDSTPQTNAALELLEVETAPPAPQRGGEIIATFFWRRRADERAPVLMQVRLLDEQGTVHAELVRQPVLFTYPVRVWRRNELVADSYALPIPHDAPPGKYRVSIRALDERTNAPLEFVNPRGETTSEFFSTPLSISP